VDIEGPVLDSLKRQAKKQLRQRMRALRGAVPPAARAARSAAIVRQIEALPELSVARSVALYWPMEDRGEVDVRELHVWCRERGVVVFYPRMGGPDGPAVEMCRVDAPSDLAEAGHGFLEPPPGASVAAPGDLDVVVVPALAVCESGHRLGYGSGFYDVALARFRPPARAVVVAFDFQLLAELPVTEGDVACDVVVTDARVLRVG
jgi:5-formyltetrahydrofolate cyclo-ligase